MGAGAILGIVGVGLGLLGLAGGGDDKKTGGGGGGTPGGGGGTGGGGGGGGTPGDGGGGVPGVPLMTCDQAFGQLVTLAPPLAVLIDGARTTGTAGALLSVATAVEEGAAKTTDPTARATLNVVAQCLRKEASAKVPGTGGDDKTGGGLPAPPVGAVLDHNGVNSNPKGGAAIAGCASNPKFTWVYVVKTGDSPSRIATKVFGAGGASSVARWDELVDANPTEHYTGRHFGTVGTRGTVSYGWASLRTGDAIVFPKSWNQWIDQEGTLRGDVNPYVVC